MKILIGALVAALAMIALYLFQPNTIVITEPTVATLSKVEKPQEEITYHVEGMTSIVMETKTQN